MIARTLVAALVVGAAVGPAMAHEERLVVGRIDTIEPARKLLVVVDAQGSERRRLEVNPETEVVACHGAAGLAALRAGAMVRVKYLEKAGAASVASSVFLLGSKR
jgi:hypothetical protein